MFHETLNENSGILLVVITAIYAVATIILVVVVNKQFRSQKENNELQLQTMIIRELGRIDEIINDGTSISQRKQVFDHASKTELHGHPHTIFENTSGTFDRVGAIVSVNNVLLTEYLKLHAQKTGKLWLALQEYVETERKEDRRDDPEFRKYFEMIGKKSVDYYNKEYPDKPLRIKMSPKT